MSYLAGLGLKAHTFLSDGEFAFDYQIDLPNYFRLELNIGLQGDPDNLADVTVTI